MIGNKDSFNLNNLSDLEGYIRKKYSSFIADSQQITEK